MGNSNKKVKSNASLKYDDSGISKVKQSYLSQMSLGSFVNNLSGRSFASAISHQSTYSVSRPWSRVSRRRWHETTLSDPFKASKTAWPVPYIEALFLPEFKIQGSVAEHDFIAVGTIAKGAFGRVYRVLKKDMRELYALKIMSKSKIISENAVHQVKEEVTIQSACGHNPFIVNCPFYWQNRKRLFIVSEYMPGGELLKLSQQYGPLPDEVVQVYIAEIACAVDFLHNAGVIYRDLKLENVLLDAAGHAQLVDFGLAKWLKYGCRTATICGTLLYMAPEVVGTQPYTHAVDWWSLGVVACCLLTCKYPVPVISHAYQDTSSCQKRDPGSLPGLQDTASCQSRDPCLLPGHQDTYSCQERGPGSLPGHQDTASCQERGPGLLPGHQDTASCQERDPGSLPGHQDTASCQERGPGSLLGHQDTASCQQRGPGSLPGHQDTASCLERVPGSLPGQCALLQPAARTLLLRLLDRNPHTRLRSLLKLQEVAFFKDFNFAHVRSKKISPVILLRMYFPNGPPMKMETAKITKEAEKTFEEFDSDFREW